MGARWTEVEISTFWDMKDGGASLKEIAKALGRPVKSVENKSLRLTRGAVKPTAEQTELVRDDGIMPKAISAAVLPPEKPEVTALVPKDKPQAPRSSLADRMAEEMLTLILREKMRVREIHIEPAGEDTEIYLKIAREEA